MLAGAVVAAVVSGAAPVATAAPPPAALLTCAPALLRAWTRSSSCARPAEGLRTPAALTGSCTMEMARRASAGLPQSSADEAQSTRSSESITRERFSASREGGGGGCSCADGCNASERLFEASESARVASGALGKALAVTACLLSDDTRGSSSSAGIVPAAWSSIVARSWAAVLSSAADLAWLASVRSKLNGSTVHDALAALSAAPRPSGDALHAASLDGDAPIERRNGDEGGLAPPSEEEMRFFISPKRSAPSASLCGATDALLSTLAPTSSR
eukprot:6191223-Pleurochrysis_carterae.AAC.1